MARRKNDPPISGVLLIDKPGGLTSHDVVSRARRVLGVRRIGHAGTLDPMATGVLVLGVGPSTRLLGIVGSHDKEYSATIRLGASTSTDDAQGEVLARCEPDLVSELSEDSIRAARDRFLGTIKQRPSSVSAVKIDGKRAYERVRSGEDVELPEREVRIDAFEILAIQRHSDFIDVGVRVECSAGTYIRALARDLGTALGVGGHLTELRRTRSGAVEVQQCQALDEISAQSIRPAAWLARAELSSIDIDADSSALARNGTRLPQIGAGDGLRALIGPDDDLVAIVEPDGSYRAVFPTLNS